MLRSLRIKFPEAEFHFLLRESYADVLKNNPYLSKAIDFESLQKDLSDLKSEDYSLVVDLQNNIRSRRIVRALGKPSVRYKKNDLKKFLLVHFGINLFTEILPVAEAYISSVPGLNADGKGSELFLLKDAPAPEKTGLKTYIGLCPGARHFTKRWPEEYFIELGRILSSQGNVILLIGGQSDIEICQRLVSAIPGAVNCSTGDDLCSVALSMSKCKCMFCNDSGLMHLACGLGVPVVSFFGSSVEEFGFYPYKSRSLVLERPDLKCRPCSHIGRESCPKGHFLCMREISPAEAASKFNEITL